MKTFEPSMRQETELIDRLEQFVENTRESADKIEKGEYHNEDHANGVACGLNWAAHELESVLEDFRTKDEGDG